VNGRFTILSGEFGKGQSHSEIEAISVLQWIAFGSAIVVAEHLFVNVTAKMERFDSVIGSMQSTLQQRPEVLQAIGVDATTNIFHLVIHNVMRVGAGEFVVSDSVVGVELGTEFDVIKNLVLQGLAFHVRQNLCANLSSIAAKDSLHSSLVRILASTLPVRNVAALLIHAKLAALVHVASGSPDESLIGLNFALASPKLAVCLILHSKSNTVKHEPCRLLGDLQIAGDFVTTDSILAVSDQPRCGEPLVERDRGIFHDGPDLDGELPLRVMAAALPPTPIGVVLHFVRAAGRAYYFAIWPAAKRKVVNAVVRIREVNDCLLKAFGFHWLNSNGMNVLHY